MTSIMIVATKYRTPFPVSPAYAIPNPGKNTEMINALIMLFSFALYNIKLVMSSFGLVESERTWLPHLSQNFTPSLSWFPHSGQNFGISMNSLIYHFSRFCFLFNFIFNSFFGCRCFNGFNFLFRSTYISTASRTEL